MLPPGRDTPAGCPGFSTLRPDVDSRDVLAVETLAFPLTGLAPATGASLLLGEIGGCGDVTVAVRATSSKGDPLGSTELTVPSGGYVRLDALASALGVADLTGAQVRVVAIDGPGLFWGEVVSYFGAGMRVVADGLSR